jgi:lipoprotein-anchoring transpeptidase ErfK/SrfK
MRMSYRTYSSERLERRRRRRKRAGIARALAAVALLVLIGGGGLIALAAWWPAARILADPQALAAVKLAPAGERVASFSAVDARGRRVPVSLQAGKLWPTGKLPPGDKLELTVTVRRAGWAGWLVGGTDRLQATVTTPQARVTATILRPQENGPVAVTFDRPVAVATLWLRATPKQRLVFQHPRAVVQTGVRATGRDRFGTVTVSAAARSWETPSAPVRLSWFPAGTKLQALVQPVPGTSIQPLTPITLTFSEPVATTLGSARPTLEPAVAGAWTQTAPNALTFQPSGNGYGLGTTVKLHLPVATDVGVAGHATLVANPSWRVPLGSTLRLQQLLSQLGYLPLAWQPADGHVPSTPEEEAAAAVHTPAGSFSWRYPDTPTSLRSLWKPGGWTRMMQGAVMAFEHDQGLAVDGIPGPQVWHALTAAALAGEQAKSPYSYVLVHRSVPQTLELWNDGETILQTRVNTGVPAAPTPLGTHAVFEHIPIGTMRGRNPDGSRYVDHGILWISYFNGGEAIHGFDRATYGFPQSVGCVEASNAEAKKIWPYTPIGTLVTIVP